MNEARRRLVTKGDLDGLACGILLRELGLIDRAAFVHPKDIESGKFPITGEHVTAGLPFQERAHLAFDHLSGPRARRRPPKNLVVDRRARSTARVIWRHFGGARFPNTHPELLDAADKGSSADLIADEILYPAGWPLLDFLIDPRTGLESRGAFRLSHDELLNELIEGGGARSVTDLLSHPDVEERLELYFASVEDHKSQIMRCSTTHRNLVVTDLRSEEVLHPGNKFVTHALFPECNVSLEVSRSPASGRTVFSAGKSILDRSSSLDIGRIMRRRGGGGHPGAGACQTDPAQADDTLRALIEELRYGRLRNLLQGYFNYY